MAELKVPEKNMSTKGSGEATGPKDFAEDHVRRDAGTWEKRDGHPSLFQEDPLNGNDQLTIEMGCGGPDWE